MLNTTIPGTSVQLSRLGLGCASLVGGVSGKRSIHLVEAAFECGITHFDVAPSYGLGLAEDVIGDALRRVRDQITVATKVGFARPAGGLMWSAVRAAVGPFVRMTSAGRQMSKAVGASLAFRERAELTPAAVRRSLNESLRHLRMDRVEILLLHEAEAEQVSAEMRAVLDELKEEKLVCAYGIGNAARISRPAGNFGDVAQGGFHLGDAVTAASNRLVIWHRVITNNLSALTSFVQNNREEAKALSIQMNFDLFETERLPELLVAAALEANRQGVVLIATRRIEWLRRYARLVADGTLTGPARRLTEYFGARAASAGPFNAIATQPVYSG